MDRNRQFPPGQPSDRCAKRPPAVTRENGLRCAIFRFPLASPRPKASKARATELRNLLAQLQSFRGPWSLAIPGPNLMALPLLRCLAGLSPSTLPRAHQIVGRSAHYSPPDRSAPMRLPRDLKLFSLQPSRPAPHCQAQTGDRSHELFGPETYPPSAVCMWVFPAAQGSASNAPAAA